MTLNEIIQDIHGLDAELAQLEKRYGLLSDCERANCELRILDYELPYSV